MEFSNWHSINAADMPPRYDNINSFYNRNAIRSSF